MSKVLLDGATVAKVVSLIERSNETGEVIAAWEEIQELLLECKLAYKQKMPPEFCGIHGGNRTDITPTHTYPPSLHAACRLAS